jgi:hypothetical protein
MVSNETPIIFNQKVCIETKFAEWQELENPICIGSAASLEFYKIKETAQMCETWPQSMS